MRTHGALLPVAALLLAGSAFATTIQVPADQPTIAAGLAAAAAGDTVLVACGEYYEHDLVLPAGVTLRGPGQGVCVWLWGEGQGRLISGAGLTPGSRIENFVLVAGAASAAGANGGAMSFSESTIEIRDCWFTTNRCDYKGGAVLRRDNAPLLEGCVFHGNDAAFWGGGLMLTNSAPTLRGCTLARNDAYQGGGLWGSYGSAPVLENCLVAFNTDGSGLFAYPDPSNPSVFSVSCSDVYGNAGGGYGGDLADQTGLNGNIAGHPLFCDLANGEFGGLMLAADSPCLPANNGCGVLMGALGQGCEVATAVPATAAARCVLLPNRPNPFNPSTELRFALAEPAAVRLAIHDLAGRRLRLTQKVTLLK